MSHAIPWLQAAGEPARLEALDRRFSNALPGWCDPLRNEALNLYAGRQRWCAPEGAWPTLPSACLRRARAVAQLGPQVVLWYDDLDGASLLVARLCPEARVVVVEPRGELQQDLSAGAEALGVSSRWQVVSSSAELERELAACVLVHPLVSATHLRGALQAARHLRPEGHLLGQVATYGMGELLSIPTELGFRLVQQHREMDCIWVPGPFALDSARDVAVFHNTIDARAVQLPPAEGGDEAERLRVTPYAIRDFHDLVDAVTAKAGALDAVGEHLARHAPHPEHERSLTQTHDRELLTWYDERGYGVTLELRRSHRHLIATLAPYHAGLDFAVHWAVLSALGDEHARSGSQHAPFWHMESIVG